MYDETKLTDLIPTDMVVNLLISVAWKIGRNTNRNDSIIPVYNCCSSPTNPITCRQVWDEVLKDFFIYPFNDIIWYPMMKCHSSWYERKIYQFFQDTIPGLVFDTVAKLRGFQATVRQYQKKIDDRTTWLNWYGVRDWTFQNDNVRRLNDSLSPCDRKMFYFDVDIIHWPSYMKNYVKGIRQFLLNEHPDTLHAARCRIFK